MKEQLCGHEFSAATISRVTEQLDEELKKFARRPLEEEYPYLVLDARYEKIRQDGVIGSSNPTQSTVREPDAPLVPLPVAWLVTAAGAAGWARFLPAAILNITERLAHKLINK